MVAQPRLTAWEAITDDTARCVAVVGDSTWGFDGYPFGQPGPGPSSSDYFRQVFAKRWPVRGPGIRLLANAFEWTLTTGGDAWTAATTSDAWDVGPYRFIYNSQNAVFRANTATKVATWSTAVVRNITDEPVTSFKLGVVDGASSANFSYRIDGGTWTNVSNTWNQNNSLDQITINSAVTSTVEVRGANAAGTNVTVYLAWIEPITGTGAIFHDLSVPGERLRSMVRTTSGDALKWVDVIQPDVVFVGYTNDVVTDDIGGSTQSWNALTYAGQLQTLSDRVQANGGQIVPITYWGQDRSSTITSGVSNGTIAITGTGFAAALKGATITGTDIPAATTIASVTDATHATLSQAATGSGSGRTWAVNYSANVAAQQSIHSGIATSEGVPLVDLLDRYGDFTAISAAGLNVDTLHPSDAGTVEIVRHNVWPIIARGTKGT